jgi:hypothetical protein
VVGFTTGSRGEVPGKKENLLQDIIIIIIIPLGLDFSVFVTNKQNRF